MSNQLEVHKLIDKRWSPRAFDSRPVEEEKIQKLFKAASLAASCYNEQPWRFVYATKDYPERYDQLLSCLGEFNQLWVKTAPMIVLTLASKKFVRNGNENHHHRHDMGLAIGNMSMQAMSMDLYLHQMAGFSPEKAREIFGVPEDFDIVTMIAVGYLGQPDVLPEEMQKLEGGPRVRRSFDQIVFDGDWKKMY
jgi:nitroreductase